MSNELLPCLKCKSEIKITYEENRRYKVSCKNCGQYIEFNEKSHIAAIEFYNNMQSTPPNPPLTLEQLKERVGKPVWCKWLLKEDIKISKGKWFIVVKEKEELVCKCPLDYGCHICSNSNYEITWLAYDHEPKGELL